MFNSNLPWLSDNEGEWAAPSNGPGWMHPPKGSGAQSWNYAHKDWLSSGMPEQTVMPKDWQSGMPGQYQGGNMPNSPTFNYGNPGMFQGFQQPGMYPPQQMQQPMMPQGPRVRADIQEAADRWASGQATAAELQHYGNAPKTQQGFIDRWTDMAGRGKFPGETATSAYVNGSGQQVNAPWMPQRDTAGVSNAPPTRYPQFTGFGGMFGGMFGGGNEWDDAEAGYFNEYDDPEDSSGNTADYNEGANDWNGSERGL
jgi:hypothetical protein